MENQNVSTEEKWWGEKHVVQQINGFWFLSWMIPGIQRVLTEFKPRPNDVILASFMKTGTTWLKSMLYSIINPSSLHSLVKNHPHDLVPLLETNVYGVEASESSVVSRTNLDTTRIFNTHIPYQLLGETLKSSDCRVIYITRNPKDTFNSLWHFVNKGKLAEEDPWEMEEAVEKFCLGSIPFGPYYEHVMGYRSASLKNPDKIFFITYEELKNNPVTHVKKLVEFLGCPFAEDDNKVEKIVKSCSFEVMSSHEVNKSNDTRGLLKIPNNSFFRQGKVGDHKNYLNDDVIERIDALTREKFHKSGFIYGV